MRRSISIFYADMSHIMIIYCSRTDLTPTKSRSQQPTRNQRAQARPTAARASPIVHQLPNRLQPAPIRDEEPVYIPDDNEEDPLLIGNACKQLEAEVIGSVALAIPFPYESLKIFDRFLEANLPRLPLSLQVAVWRDIHETLAKIQGACELENVRTLSIYENCSYYKFQFHYRIWMIRKLIGC